MGVIELNRPKALNALDEEMLRQIETQLLHWQDDDDIKAIFLHSDNPKAFCSGGDVKTLAQTLRESNSLDLARTFFTQEYFTDALMHCYRKPVVAWLDGICMGGGLGLSRGAPFRIATERTVMSMPEVFIGFFPDVGGTRFLSDIGPLGIFLGLTGNRFSGAQAVNWGVATHFIPESEKERVLNDLLNVCVGSASDDNDERIRAYLAGFETAPQTEAPPGFEKIRPILETGDFVKIAAALEEWRRSTGEGGRRPSPLSQATFWRLSKLNRNRAWTDVFETEWSVALRFCENGEFTEGVRALLIDKEPEAKWPERSWMEAWDESEKLLLPFEPNLLREKFRKFREQFSLG